MSDAVQKQLAVDTHSEQAELFANRYEEIKEDPYRNCFVYSRRRLNLWLDKFMPERGDGLKLLDVGCGTGYHLARYRERGFDISGMDGSEDMLKQARLANPNIDFKQGDVDSLPYPDNTFDYILCVEVYRYLPDINPCTKEIFRVLKPNGVALVTAAPPLQANLYPLVNRLTAAFKVSDLTQLKQFFQSEGLLRKSFTTAKFAKTDVHGIYGGSMIWLERLAPKAVMPPLLKGWEKIDEKTADAPVFRHFSNMLLVHAKK